MRAESSKYAGPKVMCWPSARCWPASTARRRPTVSYRHVSRSWSDTAPTTRWTPAAGVPKPKPSVRKLAADLLVDLNDVPPGDDGLISRDAVLAAAGVGAERPGVSYDVLPVRGVHAHMADRMTLSRSNIPDAHASVNVDCTALVRLRDRLSAARRGRRRGHLAVRADSAIARYRVDAQQDPELDLGGWPRRCAGAFPPRGPSGLRGRDSARPAGPGRRQRAGQDHPRTRRLLWRG